MAEVLAGTSAGEQLVVKADKTQVYGLKGNDTLVSNKDSVLLVGGSGDDKLIMSGGTGTLNGGKGNDTFELTYSADEKISVVIEDFEPASDKIVVNYVGDTKPKIKASKSGNDVLLQSDDGQFSVTLKSVRENDYFDGAEDWDAWEAYRVLERTNTQREAQGLAPLTLSESLMESASIRAGEIISEISHTRPNGTDYSTLLKDDYRTYGENLEAGASSPEKLLQWLMNSQDHKDNILRETFTKIGIGYRYSDSDKSHYRYYWAQEFGGSLKAAETVSASELLKV